MKKNNPGISDDLFIRGDVPMTKEEIRVLSLSKMKIEDNSSILDIGAGTGSVSVEIALTFPKSKITAVEKNREAIELIYHNIRKFGADNIEVVEGSAPEVIPEMDFDSIFIGGSSGSMELIFDKIYDLLKKKGIVVVNATLIETFHQALQSFEKHKFNNVNYIQVQINRKRKLGIGNGFKPISPVFIIWGEK